MKLGMSIRGRSSASNLPTIVARSSVAFRRRSRLFGCYPLYGSHDPSNKYICYRPNCRARFRTHQLLQGLEAYEGLYINVLYTACLQC